MLRASTEEEDQHAVLSLKNRKAQCRTHRMGGCVCQTEIQDL